MKFVQEQRHVWEARHGAWVLRVTGGVFELWTWELLGDTAHGLVRLAHSGAKLYVTRHDAQKAVRQAWEDVLMRLGVPADHVPTPEEAASSGED